MMIRVILFCSRVKYATLQTRQRTIEYDPDQMVMDMTVTETSIAHYYNHSGEKMMTGKIMGGGMERDG